MSASIEAIDAQWTNVQDPVKQMITAITKAVRTQSAGIKDLDRRIDGVPTIDAMEARVQEVARQFALQLETDVGSVRDSLKRKADISDLSTLEKNTISMAKQLDKINELLHSQNNAILNLNDRITRVTADVEAMRDPVVDKLMLYVDKQTRELALEIDRKLSLKADQTRGAELAASSRHLAEEVVPALMGQVAELRAEMRDVATRSDLHILASTKANIADLNDLSVEIAARPSKADAHQLVNAQIKPLVSAITAIEKAIHVQEININNSRLEIQKSRATYTVPARAASPPRSLSREQVGDIVEDVLREKAAAHTFVTPSGMDGALSVQRQALLDEVFGRQAALKEELVDAHRDVVASLRRHTETRLSEIATTAREARELNGKAKAAVKDLASNVAKALSRKVDKTDMKKALKECGAGSKGFSAIFHDEARAEPAEVPALLTRSSAPWMQSGPLPSAGQGPTSSEESNAESARNEAELKTQLELIQDHLFSLKAEMNSLQRTVRERPLHSPSRSQSHPLPSRRSVEEESSGDENKPAAANKNSLKAAEWRLAVSELAINLRREIADKAGREEMQGTLRAELDLLEGRMLATKKELNQRASVDDLGRVEAETALLRSQVTGELTGARWLWRTGKLLKEGWIPWDTEVTNAMPDTLVWRPNSPVVLARTPGLYRICIAVFTSLPAVVQVCLNGEPIFTLQPGAKAESYPLEEGSIGNPVREDRYTLRRNRHSSGEVTCMSIDEHVSLPANSKIAVRFNSQAAAQAFFAIKKL